MSNFYEEIYQYFINEGIEDDEATEVVNHLYDNNVHEHIVLTESKGKAILNVLRAIGHMSGILKTPGSKQALKATTKKLTGTPVQTSIFSKSGKIKDFSGGKVPFPGSGPSFQGPKPAAPAVQAPKSTEAPGQMRIPGMSDRAQELRNVTGNPNLGLPGNTQGFAVSGGKIANRSKGILKSQPQRTAPSLPQPPASPAKGVDPKKVAAVTGMSGLTAAAIGSVGQANKTSAERNAQREQKLAQQRAETQAAFKPKPEPTGERSAAANVKKQEAAKSTAQRRRDAAADFDKTFAAARSAGKKEFTWRGNTYNTKLK
jgi:hypothetical protein